MLGQREVVARHADAQHNAGANVLMHPRRATAPGRLALHCDQVAVRLVRRIHERVLPHQAALKMQVNV